MAQGFTAASVPLRGRDLATSRALREELRLITFRIADVENHTGLGNSDFRMSLMPETYQVDLPQRVSVTQTRGGAFVDNFGQGIGTLTMSGTTGFGQTINHNKETQPLNIVDGYQRWVGLRAHFQKFFDQKAADTHDRLQFHILNWLQEEWYNVVPMGLPRLSRNVQQPLLFRWEMNLTILNKVNNDGYKRPWVSPDDLADIATRTQRVIACQQRMETILKELYATQVLNDDFDELAAITEAQIVESLTDTQMDAFTDSYIQGLLKRNSVAGFTLPTDSAQGIAARTRTMANNIRDYADGKTAFVNSTLQEAAAVVSGWRGVLDAADYAINLPGGYARRAKEIMCSAQSLLLYPQVFRTSLTGTLADILSLLSDSGCATTLRI